MCNLMIRSQEILFFTSNSIIYKFFIDEHAIQDYKWIGYKVSTSLFHMAVSTSFNTIDDCYVDILATINHDLNTTEKITKSDNPCNTELINKTKQETLSSSLFQVLVNGLP